MQKKLSVKIPRELFKRRKNIVSNDDSQEEEAWDKLVTTNSRCHFMQSSAWGRSKSQSKWPASRFVVYTHDNFIPIQVFSRSVPSLGRLHYAPGVSGVTVDNIKTITSQIIRQYGKGLVFKIELYQDYDKNICEEFIRCGWKTGASVQHRHTVIADTHGPEEEMFNRLKSRARREIKVAQKNGVEIIKSAVTPERLDVLASLMNVTAKRSGAFFRSRDYNNKYWNVFAEKHQGALYFARHDIDILGSAFVIRYGKNAWYKDGGSVRQKNNLFGPRLLQWEIMKDLMDQGITQYDLSGIPAEKDIETSSMGKLYPFKTAFSKNISELMPTFELPLGRRYSMWPSAEQQFLRLYSGFTGDFWY